MVYNSVHRVLTFVVNIIDFKFLIWYYYKGYYYGDLYLNNKPYLSVLYPTKTKEVTIYEERISLQAV